MTAAPANDAVDLTLFDVNEQIRLYTRIQQEQADLDFARQLQEQFNEVDENDGPQAHPQAPAVPADPPAPVSPAQQTIGVSASVLPARVPIDIDAPVPPAYEPIDVRAPAALQYLAPVVPVADPVAGPADQQPPQAPVPDLIVLRHFRPPSPVPPNPEDRFHAGLDNAPVSPRRRATHPRETLVPAMQRRYELVEPQPNGAPGDDGDPAGYRLIHVHPPEAVLAVLPPPRVPGPAPGPVRTRRSRGGGGGRASGGRAASRIASSPYHISQRIGMPDRKWGECLVCFEAPIDPHGCNACLKIIGCHACVLGWHRASLSSSCPLCRNRWHPQPDVSTMPEIERRTQPIGRIEPLRIDPARD
ncbi:unnamed protein product [Caenorhabditis sp. 36 PRJEB53466]|nr:unnamed protein product [Caenorhabditis sp. 36 PRJEB53466]